MSGVLRWLHANPEWAYLLFLVCTGIVTEVFRKRPPAEEEALRARFPRFIAVRELIRGFGWDGPKIRGALALLLLGRELAPPPADEPELDATLPALPPARPDADSPGPDRGQPP